MKQQIIATILLLAALTGAAGADTFDCGNCTDCNEKIQSANVGDVVRLTADITDCDGNCIEFNGADGVTFDGGDHVIDGDGDYSGRGICLSSDSDDNTLTNCEITGFRYGIELFRASNNKIQNISAYSNVDGGIAIFYSTANTIRDCILQENSQYDFHFLPDSLTDCNNRLIHVTGSGGRPIEFYNQSVNLQDQEFSALYLCNADDSILNNITIRGSDSLKNNGLRLFYTDNSNLMDIVSSNNFGGVLLDKSNSNKLQNIKCSNNYHQGIHAGSSSSNTLERTETNSNTQCGIYLSDSPSNKLTNITSSSNSFAGVYIDRSSSTIINNSHIRNNVGMGINIHNAGANRIYNNYFSNADNINFAETTVYANDWNVTHTAGPNIVGNPYIGGNYWSDYKGMDNNSDGFGDTAYNVNGTGDSNIDHLPLVMPMPMCGDVTGNGMIDTDDLLRLLERVVTVTPVDYCISDIDGNRYINILDVRLLMGHINDSTRYPLNCGCGEE